MRRNKIRLTESQLRNIVYRILNEEMDEGGEEYLAALDELKNITSSVSDKIADFLYDYSKYTHPIQYQKISQAMDALDEIQNI